MSEKGIKTKPTASPKVKNTPKTASHSRNPASDIKTVAKDKLVRDVIKSKVDEAKQNGQSDRAEVQAAESVEDAAYTTADTAYHNSKTFVQNRIKKHTAEKKAESQNAPKTPENVTEDNAPKTPERTADTNEGNLPKDRDSADVKTKENYTKAFRSKGTIFNNIRCGCEVTPYVFYFLMFYAVMKLKNHFEHRFS